MNFYLPRLFSNIRIIGTAVFLCGLISHCKPASSSSVKDLATSSSLKTGMFMPKISGVGTIASGAKYRIKDPEVLAEKLNFSMKAGDKYRVTTTAFGENILFVERKGMMPVPILSLAADGAKFQWSFFVFKTEKGASVNSNVYIKHSVDKEPLPWVSEDGLKSNLFLYRMPYNVGGILEPMLISWLSHIQAGSDQTLYRIGNTILDSQRNQAIMEFREIGKRMWELAGYYSDADVTPGTVFWSKDMDTFYSVTPKKRIVTKWKKQDKDSMDRIGRANDTQLPPEVAKAVEFRESQGYGEPEKYIPVNGPKTLAPDSSSIPVYATDAMYQQKAASLSLIDDEDSFETPEYRALVAAGAVSASEGEGFSLGGARSGNGPQPGDNATVTNWNNGAKFNNVQILTNEPHLVARGSINSWRTGKSDYVGYKVVGQIMDRDGKGTGQFVEQIYNSEAGVYEQRMLSKSELRGEAQSKIAAKDDEMRRINAQIAESRQVADGLGDRADAMAKEAFKRAKELPGKAVAAAGTELITPKIPKGLTPNQEAGVWAATGAGKELAGQTINRGLGVITNGAVGSEKFDGEKIVTSSIGSLVGKSGTADLDKDALGKWTVDGASKVLGSVGKEGSKILTSGGELPSGDKVALAAADTTVDVIFSASKALGPAGAAIGAAGAEITKVGNAEVGALVLTGRELSARSEVNANQTSAINTLSSARESADILEYLDSPTGSTGGYQPGGDSPGDQPQQQPPVLEPQPQPESPSSVDPFQ